MSTAPGEGAARETGTGARKADEVPINGTVDKSNQSPAEIEADIEHQREELAETLDALGAKLDVKSQAQAKAHDVKGQAQVKTQEVKAQAQVKAQEIKATTRVRAAEAKELATTDSGQPRPEVVGGAAVLVLGAIALIWWRRSR